MIKGVKGQKKLELYLFIDPLCPECWALEPVIKKLQMEYGQYFTLRHVLSGKLASLNISSKQKQENLAQVWEKTASRTGMSCDGSLWLENPMLFPHIASLAIKAAELQGRRHAIRFLRRLQEVLFLEKQNISDEQVLIECAETVGLDIEEFINDIHGPTSAKAFQCDLKITSEMEISEIPAVVFFCENIEHDGVKVTGCYPYEVYSTLLREMIHEPIEPNPPLPLEEFLGYFKFVATKEIAVVYNLSESEVELEMKKLALKQVVERVPVKYGTFWRYIGEEISCCKE